MTHRLIKKAFVLFFAIGLLPFIANLAKAQQPNISYSQSNFNFTKGIAITAIPAPNNSGGTIPNKIRGGVEESIGIGEFMATKISKSGNGNLTSLIFTEGKVQKVDLGSKTITHTLEKRDRPWSIVKDSQGNVYWTEPGQSKIVKNPSKPDETSFLGGFLEFIAEVDIPIVSDAVGLFNGINEIYGHFSDGDDLLRKITGQEQGKDYRLDFSGTIYRLAPNATQPQVFVANLQSPTGIAIDKNDNLYVTCFSANYEVKGGYSFGFGEVERVDGESGSYDAKIVKINIATKTETSLGSWTGIDYPTQIGVDDEENLIVMYSSGNNMEEINIARINKNVPGLNVTYPAAKYLFKAGTKLTQNLSVYSDMAVDAAGNLYLSEFYKDRIMMLPKNATSSNDLQVFSENVATPQALYVDLSANQLWVKDGKFTTSGTIKKLSLYGYSVTPSLPVGLSINNNGTITGTASNVNPNTVYTLTASNDRGFSKANFNLEVRQIAAPNISYATTTYNLPISQVASIPTPNNTGGSFNQQIGPQTTVPVYKGGTEMLGFAFDASGNKFFAQPDSNRIMKIDAAGKSSVYLANLKSPSDIAIDKKTGAFYYSQINGNEGSLFSILPGFDKPTELTKGSVSSIALDSDGNIYTVLPGNGQIYKFSQKEVKYEPVISNLRSGNNQPYSIAISGNTLYILYNTGGLEKRPLDNLASKTVIPTNLLTGYELDVDDYGNLFIAANSYVYKMAAGTTTLEPLNVNSWYFSGLGVDRDNNLYAAPMLSSSSNVTVVKITSGGYSISPSLPAGLTFNSNGSITGTPTSLSAVRDYTVTASNPLGTSTTTVKIGVNNIPTENLQYTVPSVVFKNATISNITPTVTGGAPQSFSISPALPNGLSFNTNNGTISGTPNTSSLTATYTVTANNTAGSKTATFNLAVTELPPASLAYTLISKELQKDISVSIKPTLTGGSNGITYTIDPALPTGLTFDAATGIISGSPTTITALKSYTITVKNDGGNKQAVVDLSVKLDPPTDLVYNISPSLLRDITIATATPTYRGAGINNFSVNPALPAGLSLNPTTGVISGKPTAVSGATTYTITATNLGGFTTADISLAVRVDAPTSLQYSLASSILRNSVVNAVTPTYFGSPATAFTVSPSLPTGLSLNETTGAISGTPTVMTAAQSYVVTATNDGGSATVAIPLTIRVDAPTNLKYEFTTTSFLNGSAIPTVTPTYTGSPATAFTVSPSLPAGLSLNEATGAISGTPTALSTSKNYTVTATNDGGNGTVQFALSVTELAPTNLKYASATYTLLRDVAISPVRPTYGGGMATSLTISPALPAGLTFDTQTGIITGTPTAISGNATYTITAGNTAGSTNTSFQLLVRVDPPANLQYTIASSVLRDIALGNKLPTYSGNSPIASFSINPTLPAGLAFSTSTGQISGTPTAITAAKNYTVRASNDGGFVDFLFEFAVRLDPPTNLRYDFRDTELQKDIPVAAVTPKFSGSPTNTFSISPALPAGLTFNTATGEIAGVPTALSPITSYTVTATNDGGTGTAKFSLSVSRIPTPEITYATNQYSFTKGTAITAIPTPTNTGVIFPQQRIGEAIYTGLTLPTGVATDAAGNTYIADFEGGNAKIKKLEKGGTAITEFVSSGLGSVAPYDLATDVAGNVYMSSGSIIKKITPNGVVSDFATGLSGVAGLFIDGENDLYAAEHTAGRVIKFDDCNAAAKTIQITGLAIGATTSVPAENPRDIVVDSQKNIYVLQSSGLSNQATIFMFLYKYFASDAYAKNTRHRVITSVDYSSYMIIDKKDNLYINVDGNSAIILNNYIDKGGRVYSQSAGKMKGLSLDADQNVFYALGQTNILGKNAQFGYNTNGLPDGLVLNANGTITGTPTAIKSETDYTVTASSFYGKSNGTLKITVVDAVPQFNYADANQILTAGVSALNIDPVNTGGPVVSYAISPTTLPAGISFDTNTGELSGTPTVLNDEVSSYTISATNTGGTATTTVTFKIIDKVPTGLVYASNYVVYLNKQFKGEVPTVAGGTVTEWSVSPALPEGLFIDATTGAITGYAKETSAAKNYIVTAKNSGGSTTATVNVEVKDLPPSISYALKSSFKFKKDITITPINAPGNDGGPIASYSALSGLPAGLNLNTSTGEITGTPTQLKTPTEYKIIADGGQWGKDTATVKIEVISLPPNLIAYDGPLTIVRGTPITKIKPTYTTNDGDPVERFSINPELPQGLSFNTANGEITGTPTEIFGGNGQLFKIKAENGAGSNIAMLVLILKDFAPAISYHNNNVFTKNTNVELNVSSTGGAVEKYRISPALPDGLTLDSLSGKISGTPTVLNVQTQYTVTGTNYGNPASTSSFYITLVDQTPQIGYTVPAILNRTVTIDDVAVNSTGGAVIGYAISPSLPDGLSLNTTTGTISGTPTVSTVAKDYVVTATNTGGSHTATINFAVKNAKPIIAYGSVYEFNKSIAISNIEPVSTGGNQITYSITPSLPSGLSLNTETGIISGTPTTIKALATYTLKAVNDGGAHTATFTIIVNEKAPGQISYAELTSDFYVGYAINPISPSVENGGGEIANYTIAPTNLAPGLTFNTSTGVISGTPTSDFIKTTYIVTAHNSGGTTQTTVTFAVIKLSATVSKTDVKCFGGATGTATANVVGGKAPFAYTWSGNGGNSETATGLRAGSYTVTIKDANNSTVTASVTINEPTLLEITNIAKVDNQQNGATNGTATATVSGGVAPYTYAWSSNSSTAALATNLGEGTYTLTVTDANGCIATKTVFIDAPPAAPLSLTAQAGNTRNIINWQASTETDLVSYKVYGGTTINPTTLLQIITAPITNYTHENLVNGTNYYYRITAVDKAGYESTPTSQVNATPQGLQSITFASSQSKTYGDADFNAGAIASSGLTVTYTTDNPLVATVVAGKIHIVGAGTVNITAAQDGNGTWLAAASQSQELTVNKRSLAVSAVGNNKVYDGSLTATVNLSDNRIANDQVTAAYSFAIFDDKNTGANKNIAVFGISISGANAGNYTANATTNTTANITPKALTIKADDKNKIQGLPLPVFTASYNGFVNGEDSNILTAKPSLSTTASSTSPQGDYPIAVEGATAQNYTITYVVGSLQVQPGTPTSIALAQNLLLENQPSGTTTGTLSSISPDPNATFTYTLVTGAGATDNGKFSIQGNTLLTATSFDYESQQSFNIRVRTTTQYGTSLEQPFTVNLTDVNEIPTLADINNQTICFTSAQQNVPLTGITAGPETNQSTTLSVSSSNNSLFSALSVGTVSNGNATLNYRVANGQSGTATITITVTDNGGIANNGVNTISKSFTITVNPLPQVAITSTLGTSFSKGKTTTLTATGGVSYQWSGSMGIIGDRNTSSIEVRPESASGSYTVVVTSAEGCTSTQSITLNTEDDISVISGTNIVTPNGDGVNDNLVIKNVDLYPNNELDIFDRAGRKIYTRKGYQNDWNGTFNGIPLAEGTYYYIINFIGVGKYKGFITIIKD